MRDGVPSHFTGLDGKPLGMNAGNVLEHNGKHYIQLGGKVHEVANVRPAKLTAEQRENLGGGKPAPAALPAKEKKPTLPMPDVDHVTHPAGFKYKRAHEVLPFKPSKTKEFGKTGLSHQHVHMLWDHIVNGKHKSLEEFADDVIKPMWQTKLIGKYSAKAAIARFIQPMLDELHKQGIVKKSMVPDLFKGMIPDLGRPTLWVRIK
jgi:hypothetical protein